MLVKEIKNMAVKMGMSAGKMKKEELIRAIQKKEGNLPCFNTAENNCDQIKCLWRDDCLNTK